MTKFNLIDMEKWDRREYYNHYMEALRCTYSLTISVDITGLLPAIKKAGKKIYPVQIYMLAAMVNRFEEFRMDTHFGGALGYWDEVNPSYTIFNKNRETFSTIWTPYNKSFTVFYENCTEDMEKYTGAIGLMPKTGQPENVFTISSVPWMSFTGFSIHVFNEGRYLPPIFTLGKFTEADGKVFIPLSLQVHHAVCDGFHVGRFVDALQEFAPVYGKWIHG